jgi:hypothetical protein
MGEFSSEYVPEEYLTQAPAQRDVQPHVTAKFTGRGFYEPSPEPTPKPAFDYIASPSELGARMLKEDTTVLWSRPMERDRLSLSSSVKNPGPYAYWEILAEGIPVGATNNPKTDLEKLKGN